MIFEIVIAFGCLSAGYKLAETIANIWLCLAIAACFLVVAQGFHLAILGLNPLYILGGSLTLCKVLFLVSERE
ncbi:hypothetical protein Lepto7376_0198 [[Leptolyngbya] sp. PCC 7376]|nr:hypothetical protein Lepto7376_0198 [[Leptolyngbya] sp. PCC 7376]